MKKIVIILSAISLSLSSVSCDKFLDIEPQGVVMPKTTKEYRELFTRSYELYPTHKSLATVRTDEIKITNENQDESYTIIDIYKYKDQGQDKSTQAFAYESFYSALFNANAVIIEGVKTMEPGVDTQQLIGEAYALRAMVYFDLVNLYAKPYKAETASSERGIVIENDIQIEQKKAPSTVEQVYQEIHRNIELAQQYLQVDAYQPGFNYRFTKNSINALQARVYLYQNKFDKALESANKVLQYKSQLQDLNTDLTPVTDFNSVESIQALELTFTSNQLNATYVSDELINSFDQENDLRFTMSFSMASTDKYKPIKSGKAQYKVSFRTSELYFIKAEALMELKDLDQAKQVLASVLVNRYTPQGYNAELQKMQAMDQNKFKAYLLEQRFKEFAFEGHRWFDLRRTDQKQIVHKLGDQEFILFQNDIRYTLDFPLKAKQNNPYL
ncbi:RagB/SusD family nutrient uptake outer membrane protein [Myroides sp. LJL119]